MLGVTTYANDEYFYSGGQRESLQIDSTKCLIKFSQDIPPESYDSILSGIYGIEGTIQNAQVLDDFFACSLSVGIDYAALMAALAGTEGIDLFNPFYLMHDSIDFVVGQTFCCQFFDNISAGTIDSLNLVYKVEVEGADQFVHNNFLLKVTDSSPGNVVEIANIYYETGFAVFSLPNTRPEIEWCGKQACDYFISSQYNIKGIIGRWDTATAWDITAGDSNLIVALLDEGFAWHFEVPSTRLAPGYDFGELDADPKPPDSSAHGMLCGGLIAAENSWDTVKTDYSGIASVAPNVKIMPLKIVKDYMLFGEYILADWYRIAQAFDYARTNGASVLSCSWGQSKPGATTALDNAISRAYNLGRGGKGCIIVCGSGNEGGGIIYPASNSLTISVGANKSNDSIWSYSSHGPGLDVVAPSGDIGWAGDLWSLDQIGQLGANPTYLDCGYYTNAWWCAFGGTSAACPLVSGVAAFLLSRRPDLTSSQVYDIIRNSAQTHLKWGNITPPDDQYGYGRVDAFRALLAVCRGDANNDGVINAIDPTYIINFLYKGGPPPKPDTLMGDANCTGTCNALDVTLILNWLYRHGIPPPICFDYGQ